MNSCPALCNNALKLLNWSPPSAASSNERITTLAFIIKKWLTLLPSVKLWKLSWDIQCNFTLRDLATCLQPRRPTISWDASKEAWPAGWGRWFCPSTLLWWDSTWSPASSSGALSTGKTWTSWIGSRGGPQKWSEGCNTFPVRKGWESWACTAWRREGCGEPSSTWRGPARKLERDFLQGHVGTGQEVTTLN